MKAASSSSRSLDASQSFMVALAASRVGNCPSQVKLPSASARTVKSEGVVMMLLLSGSAIIAGE